MSALGAKITLNFPKQVPGRMTVALIKAMAMQPLCAAAGTLGTFGAKAVLPDLDELLKTATHLKNQSHTALGNLSQSHRLI